MTLTRREALKRLAGAAGFGVLAAAWPFGPQSVFAQAEQRFLVERIAPGPGPDGAMKKGGMMLVNGTLPGPVLRVRQGEDVVVRLFNAMDQPTSIHWHGMTQRGTWWMDGVSFVSQDPVLPGETFVYRFKADPGGTHLWHSHYGVQYGEGVQGMLIVEETDNPYRDDYDSERVVLIQDWFHESADDLLRGLTQAGTHSDKPAPSGMNMGMGGGKPDLGDVPFRSALINGKGRFGSSTAPLEIFQVRRGERVRMRLANLGSTYAMRVRMDGHRMTVIAADGAFTTARTVDSLVVNIGERYDVIVEMDRPVGNYWVRANTLEQGMDHGVRAVLRYEGALPGEPVESVPEWGEVLDTVSLRPWKPIGAADPDLVSRHVLSGSMSPYRWLWDGRQFQLPAHSFAADPAQSGPGLIMLDAPGGKVMRLILDNQSDMSHPFHKHGNHFQLLGLSGAGAGAYAGQPLNTAAPITKDTVSVPPRGWAVIQWVEDNPGFWFFHCHIEWHLATGMAVVVKSGQPERPPASVGV